MRLPMYRMNFAEGYVYSASILVWALSATLHNFARLPAFYEGAGAFVGWAGMVWDLFRIWRYDSTTGTRWFRSGSGHSAPTGEERSVLAGMLHGTLMAAVVGVLVQAMLHHRSLQQFGHPVFQVLISMIVVALVGIGVAVLVERPRRGAMGPVTAFFFGVFMGALFTYSFVQAFGMLPRPF